MCGRAFLRNWWHTHDVLAVNSDVAGERGSARAVDDAGVANNERGGDHGWQRFRYRVEVAQSSFPPARAGLIYTG